MTRVLGIAVGEGVLSEFAAGGMAVSVVAVGGNMVLKANGRIVGIVSGNNELFRVTGDVVGGKLLVRTSDGGVGYFDDLGELVAGNPAVRGIDADPAAIARLNTPDASSLKLVPGEAEAGAILEDYFGATLARSLDPKVDFVITSGPNAGKTVDFIYAIDGSNPHTVANFNANFENNFDRGVAALFADHLSKASIVPVDLRYLNPVNTNMVMDYVNSLPPADRVRIFILEK